MQDKLLNYASKRLALRLIDVFQRVSDIERSNNLQMAKTETLAKVREVSEASHNTKNCL